MPSAGAAPEGIDVGYHEFGMIGATMNVDVAGSSRPA
jgi:hypothetical protein